MSQSYIEMTFDPLLTELCSIISTVRDDMSLMKMNDTHYPHAIINRIEKVSGPNAYRYWGGRYFRYRGNEQLMEVDILVKALQKQCSDPSPHFNLIHKDSSLREPLYELAQQSNQIFQKYLQYFPLEEKVRIKLYPLSTAPPPQYGRFGASSIKHKDIQIDIALGIPQLIDWEGFGITPGFMARGYSHYFLKCWLTQLEAEHQIYFKDGVKDHIVKLLTFILEERECSHHDAKLDLLQGEYEAYRYTYTLLSTFDSKQSLIQQINILNDKWPIYIPVKSKQAPGSIIELIQRKINLECNDRYELLRDERFREDLFNHSDAECYELTLYPWESTEGKNVIHNNAPLFNELLHPYNDEDIIQHCYCLFIEATADKWRLVILAPYQPGQLHIEAVLLTRMSNMAALVEQRYGRILNGYEHEASITT